jgi:outer membrane lipoprotein-sorting protein
MTASTTPTSLVSLAIAPPAPAKPASPAAAVSASAQTQATPPPQAATPRPQAAVPSQAAMPKPQTQAALQNPSAAPAETATAPSGAASGSQLSAADQAIVARVESYLDAIRTLSARFVQITADGRTREGVIYLSRPGKLRVQYDPPDPLLMIASGIYLTIYDPELKHTTFLPVESTPAWFLIQDKVMLGMGITVIKVEHKDDVIRLTLHETGHPESGRVTLVFSDQPLQLRKWTVLDNAGKPINVALNNALFDTKLDPDLFKFVDPSPPTRGIH